MEIYSMTLELEGEGHCHEVSNYFREIASKMRLVPSRKRLELK